MNRNKLIVWLPLILSLVLVLGLLIGTQLHTTTGGHGFSLFGEGKQDKFREVLKYVKNNYVDTVNENALQEKAISSMLQSLDPHSVYISASEFHALTDPLMGSFEGIGVQFRIERDTVMVILPVSGGPSEKVGIRAGDRIVRVDGDTIAGVKITSDQVMRKLKGPKDTKVVVSIYRRGVPGLTDYTITRGVIPTYSLDVAYMVEPGLGYIRLNNFSATTHEEVVKALEKLNSEGMKKLILDLRGNGGGYMNAAVDVADEFLPAGTLIVYTEGLHHPKEVFRASGDGLFENGELVILIDEFSASASEIVAGAVQDNDRGTIIGRRSFGKGLVQEQLNLKDGSAVRLTVARYYTPTGRCIQRPYTSGSEEYNNEYYHRLVRAENGMPDSITDADSLKYKTPGGKIVYGGGGIKPDIYVPVEHDSSLAYYNALLNKGLIYQFAFDYTDRNRARLEAMRTFSAFEKNFTITPEIFTDLVKYADKNGVKRPANDTRHADDYIRVLVKAYIGRNIFDNDGFFPILNAIDPGFKKAVDFLKKQS